jgi:hypothetical protein
MSFMLKPWENRKAGLSGTMSTLYLQQTDCLVTKSKPLRLPTRFLLEHNISSKSGTFIQGQPALPTSLTEGRQVVDTLEICLDAWSDFRVDTSDNKQCRWASIHHKTSLSEGPHGIPDPNYFDNCNGEPDAPFVCRYV